MTAGVGTVDRRVRARERAHRDLIGGAAMLLLVFSMSPILGHHLLEDLAAGVTTPEHLLDLCIVALRELLRPIHQAFHILLLGGLVYAVADRTRALLRLRQTLSALRFTPPDAAVLLACRNAGVPERDVRIVHGSAAPAFTAGLIYPRIYVGADVARRLSDDELTALLAHEDGHRRRRDPLRRTIWRFMSTTLFFVPTIRRLAEDLADEAEIAADDHAVRHARVSPLSLASALVCSARAGDQWLRSVEASGFHRDALLDRRVRRLAGEDARASTHLTRASVAVGLLALGSLWFSGVLSLHPETSSHDHPASAGHCAHDHGSALAHLFCVYSASETTVTAQSPCPHAADQR